MSTPVSQTKAKNVEDRVRAWLEQFAADVRARRYAAARALFAPDVLGFGTRAHVARGLAALEEEQWRKIREATSDFHFELAELRVFGDGGWLVAALPWTSTGYDEHGAPFVRPGRATLVFHSDGAHLLASHSHFSLSPGV